MSRARPIPYLLTAKALSLPFVRNYGRSLFFLSSSLPTCTKTQRRTAMHVVRSGTKSNASGGAS